MANKKEIKKFEALKVEFIVKDLELVIQLPTQKSDIRIEYQPDFNESPENPSKENPIFYDVNGQLDLGIIFDEDFIANLVSLNDEKYKEFLFSIDQIRDASKELVLRMEKHK